MSLLATRGLTKHFGGLRAVHDVDFDLPAGEVRALIGPNGAGKTTFVGMLCGRMAQTAGTVRFDGQDISDWPAHRRIVAGIAYTFQITSVFPRLTCGRNIALATHGRPHGGALARVGLAGREEQLAGDLSYGHQRLLEIGMGLAQKPRLLILDEPTQGLSDSEIAAFVALIHEVKAETTVLLIEHNMSVVMQTADRITVLNFGEILAEGPPDAIRADPDVQAAYLGTG